MDAQVRNSLEAISNLLYLIRAKNSVDPVAALIYLDLAEAQLKRLYEHLDHLASTDANRD